MAGSDVQLGDGELNDGDVRAVSDLRPEHADGRVGETEMGPAPATDPGVPVAPGVIGSAGGVPDVGARDAAGAEDPWSAMIQARLQNVLRRHNVRVDGVLLAELEFLVEEVVDEAWLSNDQAMELLPHLGGQGSLRQWLYKHKVRRHTMVSRTSDVLAAVARGDRRKRVER